MSSHATLISRGILLAAFADELAALEIENHRSISLESASANGRRREKTI